MALAAELVAKIEEACTHVPIRGAALIPAIHLVQAELGHISKETAVELAQLLDIPPTRVQEVVTFYTMFYDKPTGRHIIRLCRNLACQLRGSDRLIERAQEILGIKVGETTPDGRITLETDECLASCGTAPAMWCSCRNEGKYQERIVENLSEQKLEQFLEELK